MTLPDQMRWYVSHEGEVVGPVEASELLEWVRTRPPEVQVGLFVRDEGASGWAPIEQSPFARAVKGSAAEPAAELPAPSAAPEKRSGALLLAGAVVLLVVAGLLIAPLIKPTPVAVAATAARPEPVAPPEPTPVERMAGATTLRDAIALAKPLMADTQGEQASAGAALLALWWSTRPGLWSELIAMPDTRRADILKDPEMFRGQRICLTGTVVQIFRDKSTSIDSPIFLGLIAHGHGNYVRFLAVQSTDGIVGDTPARFCGIAIGTQSYPNVSGGTTIAVQVVGEFDIPANGGKGLPQYEEW